MRMIPARLVELIRPLDGAQWPLLIQKLFFTVTLEARWQNFRSSHEMKTMLEKAGFHDIKIHYDRQRLFPTVEGLLS